MPIPTEDDALSPSVIVTVAQKHLLESGFQVAREGGFTALPPDRALLAEDSYSVLAIVAYETWAQLVSEWPNAQAELVSLLGTRLERSAPKAWDGYLVLFCTGSAPDDAAVAQIEYDTTRVRKIVATAQSIRTTSDVVQIFDRFMPLLSPIASTDLPDILTRLPELLKNEVSPQAVEAVISAFQKMEPPLESLNRIGNSE